MKLVVFGATGGTGRRIVEAALAADHDVLAMARRPEAIVLRDHLAVQPGDVLDPEAVASAIQGADAVLSAIGPSNSREPGTLLSQGVANMLAGCARHGVRRFVFESGLMCSDGRGLGVFSRLAIRAAGSLLGAMRADKRVAEAAIVASPLDWVIVRPPALTDGAARGDYQHGVDARLNAFRRMAHRDVAAFMLRCANDPSLVRTVQDVGR